jgi:hypothetical protein
MNLPLRSARRSPCAAMLVMATAPALAQQTDEEPFCAKGRPKA